VLPPVAFRILRVIGALLVPLGLIAAAVGGIAVVSSPAPAAYHGVSTTPAENPTDPTPLSALNESQRSLVKRTVENGEAGSSASLAASLDGRAVETANGTYRLDAYERAPKTDPFAYVLYGGLVALLVGFFTAMTSHLALELS
jgi:hypothetical protein